MDLLSRVSVVLMIFAGGTACGHDMLIPAVGLLQGMRLPPHTLVLDLEPRLRCREGDARGKAVVSIKWAAA